jgi:hypothetical protein
MTFLPRTLTRLTSALRRRSTPGAHSRTGLAQRHNQPPVNTPPGAPPHPHRGQRRRPTHGAALRHRRRSTTGRGGGLVNAGERTGVGITIGVYVISGGTGERREIKPKRHYVSGKLFTTLPVYGYEPCRCKLCLEKGN